MTRYEWLLQRLTEPFGDECVLWPTKGVRGYVQIPGGRSQHVNRVVLQLVEGDCPPGMRAMHKGTKNSTTCFNPNHLEWGTEFIQDENMPSGISYWTIHSQMRRTFGSAVGCENPECLGKSFQSDWAHIHDAPWEVKREYWMQLCKSCHAKYDMTDERRAHLSEKMIGNDNPNYERIRSLTKLDVLRVWELAAMGHFAVDIAAEIGVARQVVYKILKGTTYKHWSPHAQS